MPTRWGRASALARGIGRSVRDGWLIFGIALALLLAIEGGYRLQGSLRRSLRSARASAPPRHPYADFPWFADFAAEEAASADSIRWQPYVYYRRRPFRGRYVNVDSLGHRRTVQAAGAGTARRDVFLFGGSTMWGTGQRDSLTIASRLAHRLAAQGQPLTVTNFGESGYVLTQGLVELLLQLRAGARPAAVVFYDGINEVGTAAQNSRAGITSNEYNRAREFLLGRRVFAWRKGVTDDVRVMLHLALIASKRSQLLPRLARFTRGRSQGAPENPGRTDDSLASSIARTYVGTMELVEALGRQYGFVALYFWQPALQTTSKPLTGYERKLKRSQQDDDFHLRMNRLHAIVPGRLMPAARAAAPGRFADLTGQFAAESSTVFLDDIGHTTEAASDVIAAEMASLLARHLPAAAPRPSRRP